MTFVGTRIGRQTCSNCVRFVHKYGFLDISWLMNKMLTGYLNPADIG